MNSNVYHLIPGKISADGLNGSKTFSLKDNFAYIYVTDSARAI